MREGMFLIVLAANGLLACAEPSQAQTPCPEGRTSSGSCVNASFAQGMRSSTVIASQPRFSYTAPLGLPGQDHGNYVSKNYFEINRNFTFPPVTSRFGRPES
jgi:hypothetical protein